MSSDLDQEKAAMRKQLLRRRRDAASRAPAAGAALAALALGAIDYAPGAAIAAYWPMRDEIDPRPLMSVLHARGHRIALPVIRERAAPLDFRAWSPGAPLQASTFRTQVPSEDAAPVDPDVLLVPLLAFDRTGYRLGYGGGFYDRTLSKLRRVGPALAIGLAFAAQEVEAVPRSAEDARLDWLVTEREAIRFDGGPDKAKV